MTANIVETDMKNLVYWLPKHRAEILATTGRPSLMKLHSDVNIIRAFMSVFPNGFVVYEDVKECFRIDGPPGSVQVQCAVCRSQEGGGATLS